MGRARHATKGKRRRRTDADIAEMEAMCATMSRRKVASHYGVSESVLDKQLDEHGCLGGKDYRPRVVAPWPPVCFANDNLAVRD